MKWSLRHPSFQLWMIATLPTLLISGTSKSPEDAVLLAQVRTISQEGLDAGKDPELPSQIDLLEEAEEREGTTFDVKAEDIRNWRSRVRSAYPPAPVDPQAGPELTGTESLKKACGPAIVRPDLVQREQQLAETQSMVLEEMARVEAIQKSVRARWSEVSAATSAANALQISAELNCLGWGPEALIKDNFAESEVAGSATSAENNAKEIRVQRVVKIMKSMKPKAAARILQGWDSELAVMALLRLPSRVGSKIVAELPPEIAGKLTTKLAPPETRNTQNMGPNEK